MFMFTVFTAGRPAKSLLCKLTSFQDLLMWTAFHSAHLCPSSGYFCTVDGWGMDCIIQLFRACFSTLPKVGGWKSQTNSPCVPLPPCLYAVPQPGILPSSPPLHHCLYLHSCSLLCFSFPLIGALANTKGGWEADSGCTSPWMTPRLGRGDDEDNRAEVKAEEEDLRRGVGGVVISRTRLRALCHWVNASWDEEWHPLLSLIQVSFHLIWISMKALYELEEGYEVPFGCHWHVKRAWRWQLTRSVACN